MASDKKVVTLEEHEQRLMVRGLADYRNDAIRDGKPTDDIDDLLLKVIDAPPKRKRGLWRNEAREVFASKPDLLCVRLHTGHLDSAVVRSVFR